MQWEVTKKGGVQQSVSLFLSRSLADLDRDHIQLDDGKLIGSKDQLHVKLYTFSLVHATTARWEIQNVSSMH